MIVLPLVIVEQDALTSYLLLNDPLTYLARAHFLIPLDEKSIANLSGCDALAVWRMCDAESYPVFPWQASVGCQTEATLPET